MILINKQKHLRLSKTKLEVLVQTLLSHLKLSGSDFDLTLVDDPTIQKMNHQFRKKNQATDVLSFPLHEFKRVTQYQGLFLGDLVISVETAVRQAPNFNHSSWQEICFLIIHGLLHLLGYDHELDEKEEKRMQRMEVKLWKAIQDLL